MKTYFAPPERANIQEIKREMEIISRSPIFNGLLTTASGLFAVLNEHRQVLAVNEAYLEYLGTDKVEEILGLRPGETLNCVYSQEMDGGCGTSKYCSSCGAAISIVSALAGDRPLERKCALTAKKDSKEYHLCLRVRSHLFTFDGEKFIFIFLQDITVSERLASLERVFFHDVNNLLTNLSFSVSLLEMDAPQNTAKLLEIVKQTTHRLASEFTIQRTLSKEKYDDYRAYFQEFSIRDAIDELQKSLSNHPAMKGKTLTISQAIPVEKIRTDLSLFLRILSNMAINALEASDEGEEVKLYFEMKNNELSFCVWNKKYMPEDVSLRIFQRHFSTKNEAGRGLGTYSMKLFGEEILGGKVSFATSPAEGTVFRFSLSV
ncbi:MAG: HAMP domain-containing sensor histidine kinase [Candidatus Omnitrophota bacterium]